MMSQRDLSNGGVEGGADQHRELLRFIAPSVRWIAAQHRALLRQALGPRGHRVMARLAAETLEIEAEVAKRVEARLPELLLHEVRRVFGDILGVSEGDEAGVPGPEGAAGVPRRVGDAEVLNRWLQSGIGGGDGRSLRQAGERQIDVGLAGQDGGARPLLGGVSGDSLSWENENEGAPYGHLDDEPYEGTVMLMLEASQGIGQVIQFIRDLSQEPEIRLVKLTSDRRDRVGLLLSLRQPLKLMRILPQLDGVRKVDASLQPAETGVQRILTVELTGGQLASEDA